MRSKFFAHTANGKREFHSNISIQVPAFINNCVLMTQIGIACGIFLIRLQRERVTSELENTAALQVRRSRHPNFSKGILL